MGKKKPLIIVESPTKVKTLKKFLGNNYHIESSVGHIRDLPTHAFGIDLDNDFEPIYENLPEKKDVIAKLRKIAKECNTVYLSPDPDREGEAIAWHIAHILPQGLNIKRVTFNAITKLAVSEAIKNPRNIDVFLVNAQQARRLLDRMVGYKISPLLQRRIKRSGSEGGLSAGRVQSVALKLVVDREHAIDTFTPVEYWTIYALLQDAPGGGSFMASLYSIDGRKIEKELLAGKDVALIPNEVEAKKLITKLNSASFKVSHAEKKEKKRHPVPPFITSSLQQEASRHHGFSASRTMRTAQNLYEGVDLGPEGTEGLITYIRTDSVRVEPEVIRAARKRIEELYGKEYLPPKPKIYSSKKSAQDAHEAIRPTNLAHSPDLIKSHLTPDQFKLYALVWRRFLASQMTPAIYNTVSYEIETDQNLTLRAAGSVIKFKGFLAAYREKEDNIDEKKASEVETPLPLLRVGQTLKLLESSSKQSFTQPPPRFTEASLVKELEKLGIGRPSTYASIMNKIHSRAYTVKERLAIKPTELGKIIVQMLESHFPLIMDIKFTARMEDNLDQIAEKKREWKSFLKNFWKKFAPILEKAQKEAFVPKIMTDITCPKCGNKLQKIWSRSKYFYGCSHYPECKFTVSVEALEFKKDDYAENFDWDQPCPKCSSPMKIRFGRFGAFLGCVRYADCNGIVTIPKKDEPLPEEMPTCPAIGCDGTIKQRRSRWGKPFFSCSNYPDCNVIVNQLYDLETKYRDYPKTPYVKKSKKGTKGTKKGSAKSTKRAQKTSPKKRGSASTTSKKTYHLSPELTAVVEAATLTRGEVMKKVWEYIKIRDLQDPSNRRLIVPDKKLCALFGHSESIDMMQLPGILSKHIKP